MSNLIPEKRMDKHGVMVTKHVRAGEAQSGKPLVLPSPAAPAPLTDNSDAVAKVLGHFANIFASPSPETVGWEEILEEGLPSYSREVLNAYDKAISTHDKHNFEELLISSIQNEDTSDQAGYVLFVAQQDQFFDEGWKEGSLGTYAYHRFSKIANGLHSLGDGFSFAIPESIYDADDHKAAILSALVKVTSTVHGLHGEWGLSFLYDDETGDEAGFSLADNHLIELIAEYPERAEQIGDIIYERETTDGEAIRVVLESGHAAVSDGAL